MLTSRRALTWLSMSFYPMLLQQYLSFFFFFNDTATTEIYTLSLHYALPISIPVREPASWVRAPGIQISRPTRTSRDRKSTRLNSSHGYISYAVFCLKKKKQPTKLYMLAGAVKHRNQQPVHSDDEYQKSHTLS